MRHKYCELVAQLEDCAWVHGRDMQNILVVDDEKAFLEVLVKGLQTFDPDFNVLGAENGRRAIEILQSRSIDFLVTDLKMPEMDGFELLAYMNRHFPSIPTIVITAFATPEAESKLRHLGTVRLMVKPVDFSILREAIKEGLRADSSLGPLSGVSLVSILQLVEVREKTCLIEVNSRDRKGLFYFKEGVLFNAMHGDLRKEEAALEMLLWDDVRVEFKTLPDKSIRRRIYGTLAELMKEVSRLKEKLSRRPSIELSAKSGLSDSTDEQDQVFEEAPSDVLPGPESVYREDGDPGLQTSKVKKDLEKTLQNMSKEIPGFAMSAIVLTPEGLSVAELCADPGVSLAASAPHLASIVKSNIKTMAFLVNDEAPEDILITTNRNYLLIQYSADKPFFHFVMASREESLGRIRVVMQKYGRKMLQIMSEDQAYHQLFEDSKNNG
ncbi:MAG: response regulator [Thermodesulfobacteriota bacterium]|jgi:CheY-like chemotaxis protein/predicted regulator of Ras-like GTPase activity (Roadblock/LC7/MglB family)|nr:response regulator [Thermodesulfobacteriota bacterium]